MNYEQREFNRVETYIVADVGGKNRPPKEDIEATCVDLSTGGMKVLLPVELKVGSYVLVNCILHRHQNGEFYLETQAEVKWCGGEKGGNSFEAGLEFGFIPDDAKQELEKITRISPLH